MPIERSPPRDINMPHTSSDSEIANLTNMSPKAQNRKKRPRTDHNSPPSASPPISIDQISELLDTKLSLTSSFMKNLRESLTQDLKAAISVEIQELKDDFTRTTDFITAEQNDINVKIDVQTKQIRELETENNQLKKDLGALKGRISTLEKISRDLNIELQAVPESRNENPLCIFKKLCDSLEVPITDNEIRACRRTAKFDSSSKRPRNILITLTSPRLRDTIISAVTRFNKKYSSSDMLNTSHVGITDVKTRIYVSEHLSPETKQLYAAARRFKKDNNYRFVWVRFGQIYLRKSDESKPVHVKNQAVLDGLIVN